MSRGSGNGEPSCVFIPSIVMKTQVGSSPKSKKKDTF